MAGTLYLVATPIGNFDDITYRALSVLKSVDLVVYEERREGERLLRHFQIHKPVESLNEHTEAAASFTILNHLKSGKSVALVSDCGTPVFSDPEIEKTTHNGVNQGYHKAGNLTLAHHFHPGGTITRAQKYDYDYIDRLVIVHDGAESTHKATYTYDALGRRIEVRSGPAAHRVLRSRDCSFVTSPRSEFASC